MKKALVLSLICVLGLAFGGFAAGLSGTWETTFEISPMATDFDDFVTGLTSDLEVAYALSDWTFTADSSFGMTGFDGMVFEVEGILGAFSMSAEMAFDPQRVTVWTYPTLGAFSPALQTSSSIVSDLCDDFVAAATTSNPAMDSFEANISVSIAGVNLGMFFYMDQSNYDVQYVGNAFSLDGSLQSDSWALASYNNGAGWKFSLSGSFGGTTVSSYTYFNLMEYAARSTFVPEVGKRGVFVIPYPGCDIGFYEEFVVIEGLTFACVDLSAELSILCSGFDHVKFVASGIDIGGWLTLDVGIKFTTTAKTVDLGATFNGFDVDCIIIEIGFGNTGWVVGTDSSALALDALTIHGFGLVYTWNGVTFTSYTELDAYSTLISPYLAYRGINAWNYIYGDATTTFLVPFTGIATVGTAGSAECLDDGVTGATLGSYYNVVDGLYEVVCVPTYRYRIWEMFSIDIEADSCCGGALEASMATYFGDLEELDWFGYDVIEDGDTVAGTTTFLLGDDDPIGSDTTTAVCYDTVTYDYGYAATTEVQLFNWAYTEVEVGIGLSGSMTLDLGAMISAFGWESLSVGFELEF